MCGIIGILGASDLGNGDLRNNDIVEAMVDALKRLEYRGYDSAGVATVHNGVLDRRRASGKLTALQEVLSNHPLQGGLGIGHTRWATHGKPSEANAHPHKAGQVAIVHNGIIENYLQLRDDLISKGAVFESATDAEVCAQLIAYYMDEGASPVDAFEKTIGQLSGAFALAAIFEGEDDLILCARKGSPLAIGYGAGQMFLGSDAYALAPFTNRITYLSDGDWAMIRRQAVTIFDATGACVERPETISSVSSGLVGKGGHRHFMAKEIYEQPEVIGHTLAQYIDPDMMEVQLPSQALCHASALGYASVDELIISACGTAFYAGAAAKYWFEALAQLRVEVDIASELRYRERPYGKKTVGLFISQSGETADTLAALTAIKSQDIRCDALVNVLESSIAREAERVFPISAGVEIGVASTKAFTCQLTALLCLAIAAGRERGVLSTHQERDILGEMLKLPRKISEIINRQSKIEGLAKEIAKAQDALFIGRGLSYPIALEGALKLKEISYIHAEGYAAGELKHGPIALVDDDVPIIVLAPMDVHFEKTLSNMQEVMARGGKVIMISCAEGLAKAGEGVWQMIEMPKIDPVISPILYTVPVQLLAYHVACAKGADVDQPRNLAKSVTVE